MQYSTLLLTILPLVVFVLVDMFGNMKKAVISAIVMSFLMMGYFYFVHHELDYSLVAESVLLLVLGGVTLRMNNPLFFKFQPVIVGIGLALFLGWFELFDEPYMVKLSHRMAVLMPQYESLMRDPLMIELWARLSRQLVLLFLVHAGLMAYSALKMRDLGWILMRAAIYPMLLGLLVLNLFIMRS